jgi:hypothetical protein
MLHILLIAHLIVIAMGTGMSFSNFVNLRLAGGMTGEGAKALSRLRMVLARVADVVIALIWVTGFALLWARGSSGLEALSGWFYAKLAFVVALTLCHGLARGFAGRMQRTGDMSLMGRVELAVAGVWLSALAAIVFAVLAFGTVG